MLFIALIIEISDGQHVLILQFVGQIIYLVIAIILHILPDLALL
jgi:hypothetical protein